MSDLSSPTPWLSVLARRRMDVAARCLLAVLGGYVLTALCTASLARLLPGEPAQAVLAATQLSFLIYCVLVIWAFSAGSALRAWLVAVLCCLPSLAHLLWVEVL
ncbi:MULTISPECIES: hypothetical protein [Pseudomonas]|jgi:hypothetical protein|uniref:Iron transporter n=1 Tax=Pseudomonas abyssi TaxID=170540 RepID=A0A2A3MK22_9PSED|nr:hypothetical protein [Pseudomonas abyssi]PBK05132.1 hypothetical protein CNQ84_04895 [Pseudomonas abyssi]|tara:strand:+ start:43936 stop:44247 length:312 start_codon:yes stop_codon:yes gene_type:complete